ncbi:unnamed protein product [Pedinophyceae sp. YPF-701]|nr:unnamed protein product [Pedinophyceae sp. YPF-701]
MAPHRGRGDRKGPRKDDAQKRGEAARLAEEARKQREAEERERRILELVKTVQDAQRAVDGHAADLAVREELREANTAPTRPTDTELRQRESSIKRATAIVRRVRTVAEDSAAAVCKDIRSTNLSKFVSEAVAAVAELGFRGKDAPAVIKVCSALHQDYADFAGLLQAELCKVVANSFKGLDPSDTKAWTRFRLAVRLLVDASAVSILPSRTPAVSAVVKLARPSFQPAERPLALAQLAVLTATLKSCSGTLLAGATPPADHVPPDAAAAVDALASAPAVSADVDMDGEDGGGEARGAPNEAAADERVRSTAEGLRGALERRAEVWERRWRLPEQESGAVQAAVNACYEGAVEALLRERRYLRGRELRNTLIITSRGDLPETVAAKYREMRGMLLQLQGAVEALASVLGRDPPEAAEEEDRIETSEGTVIINPHAGRAPAGDGDLFDGEEQRSFYRDLPNLVQMVPSVIADLEEAGEAPVEDVDAASEGGGREGGSGDEGDGEDAGEEDAADAGPVGPQVVAMVAQLGSCVTAAQCDEWCAALCRLGNLKHACRVLAVHLSRTPRHNPEVAQTYARVVASLARIRPSLSQRVLDLLLQAFRRVLRRRGPDVLEAQLFTVRMMGELVKFGACPVGAAFVCLHSTLDDFKGTNVDAACAFLETAGRYLARSPESEQRLRGVAARMQKLKASRAGKGKHGLDARQVALIDRACFACKPTAKASQRWERPPAIRAYVRHILTQELTRATLARTAATLARLPRSEEHWATECVLEAAATRADEVPTVAALVNKLQAADSPLGVQVTDRLLQAIRTGVEAVGSAALDPADGAAQRSSLGTSMQTMQALLRLLGACHAQRCIDLGIVPDTLLHVCTLGLACHASARTAEAEGAAAAKDAAAEEPPAVDPAVTAKVRSCERAGHALLRLGTALLLGCGKKLDSGVAVKRVSVGAAAYQLLVLRLSPLPIALGFDVHDVQGMMSSWRVVQVAQTEAACLAQLRKLGGPRDRPANVAHAAAGQEDALSSDGDADGSGSDGAGSDLDSEDDGAEDAPERAGGADAAADACAGGPQHSDDDSDDDEDDDDDEERVKGVMDLGDDLGDEVYLTAERQRRAAAAADIDDEFEAEWAALRADSGAAGPGTGGGGLGVPSASTLAAPPATEAAGGSPAASAGGTPAAGGTVSFRLLTREGGRGGRGPRIEVPAGERMARAAVEKGQREEQEREEIKRMVLKQAAAMQEEEEGAGARGRGRRPMVLTRNYRQL